MSDDNKLRAVSDDETRAEGPSNEERGREMAERMVNGIGRFLRFIVVTLVSAFPLALICWWMYSFLLVPTFLAELGYWQWYAVLVLARVIWGDDRRR